MAAIFGPVSFGAFELDLETGELRKSGRILKLQPQPAEMLCLLAGEPGKVVSREEIRQRLWGEATFVDYEAGVDYCASRIRAALCDKAQSPRFIETIPRRGYRFIAPVRRHRPFREPTLAVLPFANLSGDPAKDYFADGATDALITELARIPAVRVISRQSALHLKGSTRRLDQIARDLNVDGVVEGSALHEGDRVRLTAQLILLEPERHVWAQSYECSMSALLTTQGDAARAIAASVAAALRSTGGAAPAPVAARPAPETVETYLKARAEMGRMSAEGIGKALQYLREITAKAPDFALGLAQYALCLGSLGYWGHAPVRETYPAAKQMALNALAMDESLGMAHLVLGMGWLQDRENPAAFEREFRRAIELSPSDPDAHLLYAIFLSHVNRLAEAIAEIQYALKLDPKSMLPNTAAGWIYLGAGRHGKAEAQAKRTIEAFPDSLHAYFVLGWAAWRRGRTAEAVAAFEKAVSLSREAFSLAFLGHVYGRLGRSGEARAILHQLEQLLAEGHAPPIAFVIVHAGLGEVDAAFKWLETACRLHDDKLAWLTVVPAFDCLQQDPRYAEVMERAGLAAPSPSLAR